MKCTIPLILLLTSLVLTPGCNTGGPASGSNNTGLTNASLDRPTVAKLIAKAKNFRHDSPDKDDTYGETINAKYKGVCQRDRYMVFSAELERLGYIQLQETQLVVLGSPALYCVISLTPEGQKISGNWRMAGDYWLIPVFKREFIAVTGIIGGDTSQARAEFTWKWSPNDLGQKVKSFSPDLTRKVSPSRVMSGVAGFQKYDDGWRMVNIGFRN